MNKMQMNRCAFFSAKAAPPAFLPGTLVRPSGDHATLRKYAAPVILKSVRSLQSNNIFLPSNDYLKSRAATIALLVLAHYPIEIDDRWETIYSGPSRLAVDLQSREIHDCCQLLLAVPVSSCQ